MPKGDVAEPGPFAVLNPLPRRRRFRDPLWTRGYSLSELTSNGPRGEKRGDGGRVYSDDDEIIHNTAIAHGRASTKWKVKSNGCCNWEATGYIMFCDKFTSGFQRRNCRRGGITEHDIRPSLCWHVLDQARHDDSTPSVNVFAVHIVF